MNNHIIRKQLEFLNIGTGIGLILIGLIYLTRLEIDYAASWGIFGCMYIVMDKYWQNTMPSNSRTKVDMFKYSIAIAGICITYSFLIYLAMN